MALTIVVTDLEQTPHLVRHAHNVERVASQNLLQDFQALAKLVLVEQHFRPGQENVRRLGVALEAVVETHRSYWRDWLRDGHVQAERRH